MLHHSVRAFAAMALALLAAGCAEMQLNAPPAAFTGHAAPAGRVCHDRITVAGRFSAQYRKDGKDESVHGAFRWDQSRARARLELLSPLGQTLAIIEETPGLATFTPAGQPPRSAPDADALAATMLGWPMPVSGLRDWLQACMRDKNGKRIALKTRASRYASDGWQIAYPVWNTQAGEHWPRRIDLRRDGGGAETELSLRLVIDEWQPQ